MFDPPSSYRSYTATVVKGPEKMPTFFLRVLYSKCNPVAVAILLHNPSLLIKAPGSKAVGSIRGSGFRVTGLP